MSLEQTAENNVEQLYNIKVSEPQKLQLSGIQDRWYKTVIKTLKSDEEELRKVPLRPSYRLEVTTIPRHYSAGEVKTLEELRIFRLQCVPQRGDVDSFIGLIAENCKMLMYTRTNPFTTSECNNIERLNMRLEMQFQKYELSLESDTQLQMRLKVNWTK